VPDSTASPGTRGKVLSTEAAFTRAAIIIAELDYRLSKTGIKGELLAEQAKNRERMELLSDNARDALYYVAGWRRKELSFRTWEKQRNYRKMTTKK
jgi:hypothetical protein